MTDTSLVEAIRESIESPSGVLFPYRNIATGTTDTEGHPPRAHRLLGRRARHVPGCLGASPPPQVRLMDGVGIRAMGRLMDRVMTHVRDDDPQC